MGDSVSCYHCGGELSNWDVGDVPMEEHAKWYPKCPHVLLVMGQDYVDKVGRGKKPDLEINCAASQVLQLTMICIAFKGATSNDIPIFCLLKCYYCR